MTNPIGDLFIYKTDNGNWLQWIGGPVIRITYDMLSCELLNAEYKPSLNPGSLVHIGMHRLRVLKKESDTILLVRQHGVVVSKRWTANLSILNRIDDWLLWLRLRKTLALGYWMNGDEKLNLDQVTIRPKIKDDEDQIKVSIS